VKIDQIDQDLIDILQKDGRRSYSEIASEVGRTEVTIRRRVRKLFDEGVIKRFTVILDPLKMGKTIRAIIRVKTTMKEATEIAEKVSHYNEVTEAYFLDGTCGLLLKVEVKDLNELRQFLQRKLGNLPEIETCIVLENIKSPF
jgi:Lrp/AsnC family transcriptional regulator for asnA, asnC and gidA